MSLVQNSWGELKGIAIGPCTCFRQRGFTYESMKVTTIDTLYFYLGEMYVKKYKYDNTKTSIWYNYFNHFVLSIYYQYWRQLLAIFYDWSVFEYIKVPKKKYSIIFLWLCGQVLEKCIFLIKRLCPWIDQRRGSWKNPCKNVYFSLNIYDLETGCIEAHENNLTICRLRLIV